MGIGGGLLILHLVLLLDAVAQRIVVIACFDLETSVGLGLHKGEEQMAFHGVEQILAIVGVSIGLPLAGDEIAHAMSVARTLVEELQFFVLLDACCGIGLCATHADVERCGTVLTVVGYILFGLGVDLADALDLLSFWLRR